MHIERGSITEELAGEDFYCRTGSVCSYLGYRRVDLFPITNPDHIVFSYPSLRMIFKALFKILNDFIIYT